MLSPFQQNIGIWYSCIEDRDKIFSILLKWFENDENILKITKNSTGGCFVFKNGDTISFLHISTSSRGHRFTDSYIINPDNVDINIIQCIISPVTMIVNGGVYGITDFDTEALWYSIRLGRNKIDREYMLRRIESKNI